MASRFADAALAEGYARSRPPLHARIAERIPDLPYSAVLDLGCGAGLSTAPLLGRARQVVGIDPFADMLQWARRSAPGAQFLAGRAEALPFRGGAFDLITAAGSLNYADPRAAFPEIRRVLKANGALAIYDFSQVDFPYERPSDGAIPLSPPILAGMDTGFRVARSEPLELPVLMTHGEYVAYLNTEVSVPPPEFRPAWELLFRGYLAWLTPTSL